MLLKSDRDRAAEILRLLLSDAELRELLTEFDVERAGHKTIERIVAESENNRRKLSADELPTFFVDIAGLELLGCPKVRYLLALNASQRELDDLHDFEGFSQSIYPTRESYAKAVAYQRNWRPGQRWARHFTKTLGFPEIFCGSTIKNSLPAMEDVEPHVPLPALEDFQENLRSQVVDLLEAGPGRNRAILTLPTGAGKTRTTVEALLDWWTCTDRSLFILWIAQSEELCEQAVQAFREVWIDRGGRDETNERESLRLYRYWGTRSAMFVEGGPGVIVSTIDKLRYVASTAGKTSGVIETLAEDLGAIVIDEAHRAEAYSYRWVLEKLGIEFAPRATSPIPVLGLTATPLRSQHSETLKLAKRFYNKLLRPDNLPSGADKMLVALRNRGVLSRPIHRVLPAIGRIKLSTSEDRHLREWNDFDKGLLVKLGDSRDRNTQLVNAITSLEQNSQVLFFGCSTQHAEAMSVILTRTGLTSAAITADTKEATRRYLINQFRNGELNVLCNYGVLTTGFDAPTISAVVIGRPTTSRIMYEQMIGRGMRGPRFKGKPECLVIDIEDNLIHNDGRTLVTAAQQYADYWYRCE